MLRDHFLALKLIPDDIANYILKTAEPILRSEPNVLRIPSPVVIAGDIHGQFFDLIALFRKCSEIPKGRYLFLGDYVDRGNFSAECLFYLLALKITYPSHIFLLRGNHETRIQSSQFGFKPEIVRKYSMATFNCAISIFDAFPLVAIVGDKLFCVHGGISPDLKSISDLSSINRFHEPQKNSIMHDILWADPHPEYDTFEGSFTPNATRNCSYYFSYSDVMRFLEINNMRAIIRAHSLCPQGFHLYKKTPKGFPSVFSLFSAPHYMGEFDNVGGVLYFQEPNVSMMQIRHAEEPFVLSGGRDLFDHLVPWTADLITDAWLQIWKIVESDTVKPEIKNWDHKMAMLSQLCQMYSKVAGESVEMLPHKKEVHELHGELSDDDREFILPESTELFSESDTEE